jgi:DNA-binding MarR family transcriptional regulator
MVGFATRKPARQQCLMSSEKAVAPGRRTWPSPSHAPYSQVGFLRTFSLTHLMASSALPELFGSPALARLLMHFSIHAGEQVHFRELQRRTSLQNRSLQLQLTRLQELGLIRRVEDGRRVSFVASSHEGWAAIRTMLRSFASPSEVLDIAFGGLPGARAILWRAPSGGAARGPLEVIVLGDKASASRSRLAADRAATVLNRPVRAEVRPAEPSEITPDYAWLPQFSVE